LYNKIQLNMKIDYTERFPELKSLLKDFEERIERISLPPENVILDDLEVMRILNISKRKLAQLRSDRKIKYYTSDDAPKVKKTRIKELKTTSHKGIRRAKIYYLLCDVLVYVKRNPVVPIFEKLKIRPNGL